MSPITTKYKIEKILQFFSPTSNGAKLLATI